VKKKSSQPTKIVNRRAKFDYELGDSLVVGLELTGAEAKALRLGHGQLRGAYVTVKDDELWLLNAQITGSRGIDISEEATIRSRKLLAKRKEIDQLIGAKNQGRTIVPMELLTSGRYVKLRIAAGLGKKRYDKRETLKRRQQERDINRVQSRL
jgi:SsrA-binding protein